MAQYLVNPAKTLPLPFHPSSSLHMSINHAIICDAYAEMFG